MQQPQTPTSRTGSQLKGKSGHFRRSQVSHLRTLLVLKDGGPFGEKATAKVRHPATNAASTRYRLTLTILYWLKCGTDSKPREPTAGNAVRN